jgi:putative signal transducing protein
VASKVVIVRRFPAVIHAELARSALEAYGIHAAIKSGAVPVQSEVATIDLLVREEDLEAALEILGPESRFSS